MKIFAVARNYGSSEAGSPFGDGPDPIWYELPDSSILRSGQPFFIPDFSSEFRAFPSIAIKIGRLGKGVAERFASRYISSYAMACSVVGTSLLERLRSNGLPWSRATSFDKACLIGGFHEELPGEGPVRIFTESDELIYSLDEIRNSCQRIISLLSRDITLKEGDIILPALHPEGLFLLDRCDLKAERSGIRLLDIHVR